MRAQAFFGLTILSTLPAAFALKQSAYAQDEKPKIGFSIEAMKGERWQTDLDSFKVRAKELGAEVMSADADGDDNRQFEQVKNMIKAGIKSIGFTSARYYKGR